VGFGGNLSGHFISKSFTSVNTGDGYLERKDGNALAVTKTANEFSVVDMEMKHDIRQVRLELEKLNKYMEIITGDKL
jgi:hypothetical protein